jgi:hypothetical protein
MELGAPSNENPHSTTRMSVVLGVASCSRVLMAVPVVTGVSAAVVTIAPLVVMYRLSTASAPGVRVRFPRRELGLVTLLG